MERCPECGASFVVVTIIAGVNMRFYQSVSGIWIRTTTFDIWHGIPDPDVWPSQSGFECKVCRHNWHLSESS